MKELLIVSGLIGAAVLLLSVGVILRKDHSQSVTFDCRKSSKLMPPVPIIYE